MSDDKIRTGLWKKESNNGGDSYYGGSVEITEPGVYWVNLYKNDRKETDKHPDLNLQLKLKDSGSGQQRQAPQRQAEPDGIDF